MKTNDCIFTVRVKIPWEYTIFCFHANLSYTSVQNTKFNYVGDGVLIFYVFNSHGNTL